MDIRELITEMNFIKWEIGNINNHCDLIVKRIDKFQKQLFNHYAKEIKNNRFNRI